MIRYALIFAAATLPAAAHAQQADVMSEISALIDARSGESAKTARQLWEWAEVGYQEQKSSDLLKQSLKANGFKITPASRKFRPPLSPNMAAADR